MCRVDLSIIVVSFNSRGHLGACLEAIPRSTVREWELIVVDNASTDGSADFVAATCPAALLVRNPRNRGFAAAVNQGLDRARGRYVLLLNPDATLSGGSADLLMEELERRSDIGIVAPQLLHGDGRLQHSFDVDPTLATSLLNKSLLRRLWPGRFPSKRQEVREPREVENVIGAAMMFRADLVGRIGRFDEEYFLYIEETDFCRRARRAGWKVVLVPAARVVHLQGRSRVQVAVRARIEYVRSLFTFFRKHRPAGYFVLRLLYPWKNLFELAGLTLANLATLFLLARSRRRWVETAAVLGWQLLLCPRGVGLRPHG